MSEYIYQYISNYIFHDHSIILSYDCAKLYGFDRFFFFLASITLTSGTWLYMVS